MSSREHRPPRVAEALLARAVADDEIREGVLGDLHELYVDRIEEVGERRAALWYRVQAIRLSARYSLARLRRRRYTGPASAGAPRDGGDMLGGLTRQVRLSIRSLLRSPGFSAPALFILAVGMTAATAIFTVVDSIAFRPLDLPDSGRLVILCEDHPRIDACIASPGNTEDFRRATSTLSELGFGRTWPFHLTDDRGTTGVAGGLATAGFLRALGVEPAVGRIFTDDEHGPDRDKVVMLSHAFWTTRYGADPGVVGTVIQLSGEPYEVVGVLPAGFDPPFDLQGRDLWKPPHFDPLDPEVRGWRGFRAIGRLAGGATVAAASAELTGVYAGIAETHEEVDDEWRLRVEPLLREVVGDTRPVLLAFLGAAGLLLLIVCANVANLVLVRGLGRQQELAVRAALGAARRRLVGEVLVESLVLAAVGGVVAVALSGGATRALLALAPPGIPRLDEVAVDGRVLAFTAAVSIVATLTFAILPTLRVTRAGLARGLKSGKREGDTRQSARLQQGLVVAEVALSLVLVSSAGLLTRSFLEYLAWEPGFEPDRLMAVSAFVDVGKYTTRAQFMGFFRQEEEALAALPGVVSAATASAGPLFGGGDGATPFVPEGGDETGQLPSAQWYDVGPGYFATLDVPIVSGREITEEDGPGVEPRAVVNEALARIAWPEGGGVGRVVRLPELDRALRVVGIVSDVPPLTPGEAAPPEIYWSNRQLGRPATFFLVQTTGEAALLAQPVRETLLAADPDLSLGTPYTLASSAGRALVRPRFQAVILIVFAAAALLLSVVGVYAVVSYSVLRRLREVGIRVALGARKQDVVGLIARSTAAVGVIGIALGLVGSALVGPLIRGLLPGVDPVDPVSLGVAGVLLAFAVATATVLPARRAARADPLRAIQAE